MGPPPPAAVLVPPCDFFHLPNPRAPLEAAACRHGSNIRCNHYNLLITEHDVPKLSGVELVKKLRAAHMALPVVMAANRLPVHELARNPALQLAATLVKPFAVDELLNTVKIVPHAMDNPGGQIAAQAPVTTQTPPQIHEHYGDYSHWGLNE